MTLKCLVPLFAVCAAAAAGTAAVAQEPPPVPAVPPAPPVPVADADVIVRGVSADAPRYQYTIRTGDTYQMRTPECGVAEGQRKLAAAQPGDCLVVDRAGRRYLITDPEILKRIQENYAGMRKLGAQMGEFGKGMGEFGKKMGELGGQMGALGKQMEEARRAGDGAREAELKKQMKELGDQMRAAGEPMKQQGERMKEVGKQLKAEGQAAETRLTRIIDTAFLKQLAVEQPQP